MIDAHRICDLVISGLVIALLRKKGSLIAAKLAGLDDDALEDEAKAEALDQLHLECDGLVLDCYLEATGIALCDDPASTRAAIADWALEQTL